MEKSSAFFKDLNIENLNLYFDSPNTLARKFGLRGIPTTILFNKDGKEFARLSGASAYAFQLANMKPPRANKWFRETNFR